MGETTLNVEDEVVTDVELRDFIKEQIKIYPNFAKVVPPSWPSARRLRVSVKELDDLRGEGRRRPDKLNLPILLAGLGDPDADPCIKAVTHKALLQLDWFAGQFSEVDGAVRVLSRVFRNPDPAEFWAVLHEVLFARTLLGHKGRSRRVIAFGKRIPGSKRDADIAYEEAGKEHLADVEARAPWPLDKAGTLEDLIEVLNREAIEKAQGKFGGASPGIEAHVCLIWRPSKDSVGNLAMLPKGSLLETCRVGSNDVHLFHLKSHVGYDHEKNEGILILSHLNLPFELLG